MKLLYTVLLSAISLWGGDLSSRFDLTLQRILKGTTPRFDDDFVLADVIPRNTRRFTNFSGDVSGRYIGAVAMALQLRQQPGASQSLDRIVRKALQLQKPDGHFGDPLSVGKVANSDMATLWGNGRILIGLLEYYRYSERPEVLDGARKLGDFLVGISPLLNSEAVRSEYNGEKFAVGYICWTQNLEGLVELYRVTRDGRYLALSKELAARTDRHPSQHSHGFLTTVRGIVDLYRATGDRRYLAQAETEWKGIVLSGNVLVQGGVPEMFAPQIKRDEGCSEADWLRLALDLWRETGNPEYLRQAEYTLFNEFSFNQFHTGDFGHHILTSAGVSAPTARAWWCCTFHGLRAMVAVFQNVFHEKEGVIYYDLPVDGEIRAAGLALTADSALGQNGTVRLRVREADSKERTIAVRVPDWAEGMTVLVGGKKVAGGSQAGGSQERYVKVRRAWKSGEQLTLSYAMKTRLRAPDKPGSRVAVLHGPWLLAVDEALSPGYFDEPSSQNQVQLPAQGDVKLEPAGLGSVVPTAFTAMAGHLKLTVLPGGYPVQPNVVTLRPMAEFTSGPDSNHLEFWLPIKPELEKLDSNYHP